MFYMSSYIRGLFLCRKTDFILNREHVSRFEVTHLCTLGFPYIFMFLPHFPLGLILGIFFSPKRPRMISPSHAQRVVGHIFQWFLVVLDGYPDMEANVWLFLKPSLAALLLVQRYSPETSLIKGGRILVINNLNFFVWLSSGYWQPFANRMFIRGMSVPSDLLQQGTGKRREQLTKCV